MRDTKPSLFGPESTKVDSIPTERILLGGGGHWNKRRTIEKTSIETSVFYSHETARKTRTGRYGEGQRSGRRRRDPS